LTALESKQDELTARLAEAPQDVPDIHPGIAEAFRRKVERLTETLAHPEATVEATNALREVIDRVIIMPGSTYKGLKVMLQGDLPTILDWIERSDKSGQKSGSTAIPAYLSVSNKTRASSTSTPPRKTARMSRGR
jgi:hypothetical protein